MKTFAEFRIDVPSNAVSGEVRAVCPECSGKRHKSKERDLSVNIDKQCWICHHCGWSGCLEGDKTEEQIKTYFRPVHIHVNLSDELKRYLNDRGITDHTIVKHGICQGDHWIPEEKRKVPAIKFPYWKGGVVVNAKYRTLDKRFRQEKDAEACLYRFDDLTMLNGPDIVVCEGEIDALSMYQAGILNATSVPNGAPAPNAKNYTKEFAYLESAQPIFAQCRRVLIAVDNDAPGKLLEQELARRIGVEKCYRVSFPSDCKDANDVLQKYGAIKLSQCVKDAKPYPVSGIFGIRDIEDLVLHLFETGEERGVATGWPLLDPFYTVKPGHMTIITGIPSSGKSAWLDSLIVNLATKHKWGFAIFSPENWPLERHAQNLMEKLSGKPFDRQGYREPRLRRAEVQAYMEAMEDKFLFLMPEEDMMWVDSILEKAKVCVFRYGVRGIVIDPWNELDHNFGNLTETQYISATLGKIRRFARLNNVHVWIVAHPQKLQKDKDSGKYKPPTMYEISGGAHWRNKADVGICVHRPNMSEDITDVFIQKVRFREVGKIGGVEFRYDRDSGRYTDVMVLDAMAGSCDTTKF